MKRLIDILLGALTVALIGAVFGVWFYMAGQGIL